MAHCCRTIVALKARLAVYKVCWKESGCFDFDILAAFNSAVFDGDGAERGRKKKTKDCRKKKERERKKEKKK